MYNVKYKYISLLTIAVVLTSCSAGNTSTEVEDLQTKAAKNGIASAFTLSKSLAIGSRSVFRPSASMGMFISSYLSQGAFVTVQSAINGIEAELKLLAGQVKPTTSETFSLLTELGSLLQINVPEMLNRSTNRAESINSYSESLNSTGKIAEQKLSELESREEILKKELRVKKDIAKEIERGINSAFKDENYSHAASEQEKLQEAESEVAKTKIEYDQVTDLVRRYEDMLEIASDRLRAISKNREILISGLKITEVPGIENLEIMNDSKRYKKSRAGDGNMFGSEHIEN